MPARRRVERSAACSSGYPEFYINSPGEQFRYFYSLQVDWPDAQVIERPEAFLQENRYNIQYRII